MVIALGACVVTGVGGTWILLGTSNAGANPMEVTMPLVMRNQDDRITCGGPWS
jgi:hypothetical protein